MKHVDLIIFNGQIYTCNDNFSIVTCLVINDGLIFETGNDFIAKKYTAKQAIDLEGKSVYPGFYDAHCHVVDYGKRTNQIDLSDCNSFDTIVELLLKTQHSDARILGHSWNEHNWTNIPDDYSVLSEAFPEKEVFLVRIDQHAAIVNDALLSSSGITANSKVAGGEVVTKAGKPTGLLIDKAIGLIKGKSDEADQIAQYILNCQKDALKYGLCSLNEMKAEPEWVPVFIELENKGQLKCKYNLALWPIEEALPLYIDKEVYKSHHLHIGSFKFFADGALGSKGALMQEAYNGTEQFGLALRSEEELIDYAQQIAASNYQMVCHAIGDEANRRVIAAYAKALKGDNNRRWRLEHAQIVQDEDLAIIEANSIVPSIQTTHATSDMFWAPKLIGNRIEKAYRYKTLLDIHGFIANGSDFPIEQINPLLSFYAAVARRNLAELPEEGFQMEEALSREEALKAMTVWAAYASFEELERGSLEIGKQADFVVLEKDIMQIPFKEIPTTRVAQTFIDGELVYQLT